MKRLRKGDLVKVFWNDITRTTNTPIRDAHVAKCWTIGLVDSHTNGEVKLQHSDCDRTEADTTTIPPGCIVTYSVLLSREDMKIRGTK